MQQQEINDGNELIAQFLGWKLDEYLEGHYLLPKELVGNDIFFAMAYRPSEMKWHSDWNWTMTVINSIFKTGRGHLISINFYPDAKAVECKIYNNQIGSGESEYECANPIISVYKSILEWIKFNYPELLKKYKP